jgi:hypothetical protein
MCKTRNTNTIYNSIKVFELQTSLIRYGRIYNILIFGGKGVRTQGFTLAE